MNTRNRSSAPAPARRQRAAPVPQGFNNSVTTDARSDESPLTQRLKAADTALTFLEASIQQIGERLAQASVPVPAEAKGETTVNYGSHYEGEVESLEIRISSANVKLRGIIDGLRI